MPMLKALAVVVLLLMLAVPSMAQVELGPIVVKDASWEFSGVVGSSFPDGVRGASLSYLAVTTERQVWGLWLDLGARWDAGMSPDWFIGGSTNLPYLSPRLNARAGFGYLFGSDETFIYTRFPINISF